tara:strand:+ start:1658 stop:2044 length:387 start_codon:yes stop_codon:yes gene_type:complete
MSDGPPSLPARLPEAELAKRENDWAMVTHLSGLCGCVGIPSFVGPLVCWLVKKDEFPRVDFAGKEALNFQLTMLILQLLSLPLIFVVGLGFVTSVAVTILSLVFTIVATVAANKGENYVYPLSFRMIK